MSDTVPARDRPLLPDMERLLALWEDREPPVTVIEYAAMQLHVLCRDYIAEMETTTAEEFIASDRLREFDAKSMQISLVIDDELTRALGNRAESVDMIADDAEGHTVGELIVGVTALACLLDRWTSGNSDECPQAPVFVATSREYDQLRAALLAGERRQPRRLSHGQPPIAPIHPISVHRGPR